MPKVLLCVCHVCVCAPGVGLCRRVRCGRRILTLFFSLLSLHTGTIKRLDLIHYGPLQETKAHDSAINCLQTLENCNSSWDDDDIARFLRRRGY